MIKIDGWVGGEGREVQERGNICIYIVDSHYCTAEIDTAL